MSRRIAVSRGGRDVARLLSDFGHDLPAVPAPADPVKDPRLFPRGVSRRGRAAAGRGWAAANAPVASYRMTSDQAPVYWPFITAPGLPPTGAVMGIDQHSGGAFYADPLGWVLRDDIAVTNPNIFCFGKPGGGKALDVDTPIPTPIGFVRMGDLKVGDHVYGADGRPTKVVWTSEVMEDRECYELTFSTGERVVADAGHLWQTETVLDRNRVRESASKATLGTADELATCSELGAAAAQAGAPVRVATVNRDLGWHATGRAQRTYAWAKDLPVDDGWYDRAELLRLVDDHLRRPRSAKPVNRVSEPVKTTREIARTLHYNGKTNHSITVAPAVQGQHDDNLPLDPYVLGAWLGDGASRGSTFTSADEEVVDHLREAGVTVTRALSSGPYAYRLSIEGPRGQGFVPRLRELGVLNDKHVPARYFAASIAQRRSLLAGLLDTDGTVKRAGGVEFTNTNRQIAEDFHRLACSLGYRAVIREGVAKFDGRVIGPKWTVVFTTADRVFRLSRKDAIHRDGVYESGPRSSRRYITSAKVVPSRPVRCITVEAEDGLFLATGSFITTHNSGTTKAFCNRMLDYGYRVLILGDTKNEYEELCQSYGVEPFAIGVGLSTRINPIAFGPLGHGWENLSAAESQRRAAIVFRRWQTLVGGLVGSMRVGDRRVPYGPTEARVVLAGLEYLTGYSSDQTTLVETTIPQLWHLLDNPTDELVTQCRYASKQQFFDETRLLRDALGQLVTGPLAGLFDDHTTIDVDWTAPIQSLNLARLRELGEEPVGIALLCLNSWGRGMREIAAKGDLRIVVRDESWLQLRLGVEAVKSFDADLRLSRGAAGQGGDIQFAVAHKPSDLLSAGDAGSQAATIAKDLIDLADIKILHGQDRKVGEELDTMLGLGPKAQKLVTGWARQAKGRALWRIGESTYKVQTVLHPDEKRMFYTNSAIDAAA